MSFIGDMIEKFAHKEEQQFGAPQGGYGNSGPPQVPPPWIARWDDRDQRWLFINEQTGERTFDFPQQRIEYYQGGPNPQSGYYQSGSLPGGGQYYEEKHEKKEHGMAYGAMGAAAGLAGGALLMHEGEEVKQHWDHDEDELENDVDNFPENAAEWTGRKVDEVEEIPQDVEQDYDRAKYGVENTFDNAVEDVEDAPENAAGWVGRKVGDVEQFGDNVDDAYDAGRDEARYDDDY